MSLLVVLGFGAYWLFVDGRSDRLERAQSEIADGARKVKGVLQEELGQIPLDKHALKNAANDARITARIKARFLADADLSALSISVNTTDGVVTLSGTVSSPENINKAMQLAIDLEGVREVISTLQARRAK